MKIISVIGHSKSGKTTLVEKLIKRFKEDGHSVGSIKSIHKEGYALDKEGSNSYEHRKAGASPVCAITENEVCFFFEPNMELEKIFEIFRLLNRDVLIIEGMKEYDLPAIVCGKDIEDAKELSSGKKIILYSGIMANDENTKMIEGIKVYNTLDSFEEIYKIVNENGIDISI
jgi:molybdopterin-guanine dinucleotide biosynthesis protein B